MSHWRQWIDYLSLIANWAWLFDYINQDSVDQCPITLQNRLTWPDLASEWRVHPECFFSLHSSELIDIGFNARILIGIDRHWALIEGVLINVKIAIGNEKIEVTFYSTNYPLSHIDISIFRGYENTEKNQQHFEYNQEGAMVESQSSNSMALVWVLGSMVVSWC